jgi:MerR family transcriptional regulator/heat shock protein HspR
VLFERVVPRGEGQLQRRAPEEQRREESAEGPAHEEEGLYIISVAARMLSMHPQTLRKYERVGLVQPSRTVGMLRLYSDQDIVRLRMIKHLVDELRLNLAGVEMVMSLVERLGDFHQRIMPGAGTRATSMFRAFEHEMEGIFQMLQGASTHAGSGGRKRPQ